MWSNFVQQAAPPPPPPKPAPPPPSAQKEEEEQQIPQQHAVETALSNNNNVDNEDVSFDNGDAWGDDDDFMDDDLFHDDDQKQDAGEAEVAAEAGTSETSPPAVASAGNNEGGLFSNVGKSTSASGTSIGGVGGGIGGWGSTLKSFTQHEPLNLSFGGGAAPPAAATMQTATAAAAADASAMNTEENNAAADGWDDDVDDIVLSPSPKKETVQQPTGIAATSSISGSVGGVGGWGSTLKSFTQHHEPLNLSFGGAPPPAPPITTTTTATAAAPEIIPTNVEQSSDNTTDDHADGWDDDDDIILSPSPKKEAAAPPILTAAAPVASTPLGRAAEHFGAALLASIENDDEGSYSEDHDEDGADGNDEPLPGENEDEARGSDNAGGMGTATIGGGFGGGFVMKGLSRFIEAATTPQKVDDSFSDESHDDDGDVGDDDDGWGDDDDDLDFDNDDNIDINVEKEENEATTTAPVVETQIPEEPVMDSTTLLAEKGTSEPLVHQEEPTQIDESDMIADTDKDTAMGDGWHDDEPDLEDEPTPMVETTMKDVDQNAMTAEAGEGWDDDDGDIDLGFHTPRQPLPAGTSTANATTATKKETVDSAKSSNNGEISDSIKDFVAMTESALDSEFDRGIWKTPPPKMGAAAAAAVANVMDDFDDDDDDETPSNIHSLTSANDGNLEATEKDAKKDNAKVEEDVVPKSLTEFTDFVDNLDAELEDLTRDVTEPSSAPVAGEADTSNVSKLAENKVAVDAQQSVAETEAVPAASAVTQPNTESYSYDEAKDESPEPLQSPTIKKHPSLPHQESWYLNAMEGGKGGVVYGEEEVRQNSITKGQIIPDTSISKSDSILLCHSPEVGMPLSEMPSNANSVPSSRAASLVDEQQERGTVKLPVDHHGDLKQSELKCKCLELIMPLPTDDDEKKDGLSPKGDSGFGTKKLPDGTSVLVNYEKLLQNEATKRILLQRSVDAYEHGLGALQGKHREAMRITQDQEIQLAERDSKITELEEMVQRLQDEKENMVNETGLFEAELSAALQDKEYLEREVETLQQGHEAEKEVLRAANIELQQRLDLAEGKLREGMEETSRLMDQVDMLQADLAEVSEERDVLLQQQNGEEATKDDRATTDSPILEKVQMEDQAAAEKSLLIDQIEMLQQDLSEVQKERDQLNSTLQGLTAKEATTDVEVTAAAEAASAEITSLKGTIETLEQELIEKDNEIEQLNDQIIGACTLAVEQAATIKTVPPPPPPPSTLQQEHEKLLGDNGRLQNDLSETKSTLSMLQDENESLRTMQRENDVQIAELKATIGSLDVDSGEVDRLAAEVASLTYELTAKSTECEESSVALQAIQIKLDSAEARLTQLNNSAQQEGEVDNSLLSKQLADLQGTCSILENQKSELEQTLEERANAIQSLEAQIQILNADATTSTNLTAAELQSLRDEKGVLSQQLTELQGTCDMLKGQKSDLEKSLEERTGIVQNLEGQIQSLNAEIAQSSSNMQRELSRLRTSLDEKVRESETIAHKCEELKVELHNVQEASQAERKENAHRSQEQISRLQAKIADLLKDHNSTMQGMETQLTNALQQNDEYRAKLENVESEHANISHSTSDAIAKYTEQISTLQSQNFELSTSLQTLQSAFDAKQLEASGNNSTVQQMQQSLDAMKQEMESIVHRHQELLDKNHSLMQEKADITQALEARASTAEQQFNLVQLECAKLQSNLDSSQKASSDAKQTVAELTEQIQSLRDSNAQLEDKLFEASFETPGEADRLTVENASLRKERDELKGETLALSNRIDELSSQVDNLLANSNFSPNGDTFTSVEKEALLAKINSLEEELKAEKLNELRDEITSLHEERQQLDLDNEELLVQLGLLQQDRLDNQAECEVELQTLREQVAALQEQCSRLQNDLEQFRDNSSMPGKNDDNVKVLQDDNDLLRQTISQLGVENNSLKDQVDALTHKINGLEMLHSSDICIGDTNAEEIKKLRQKVGLLELKLSDKVQEVESARKECSSQEEKLKEMTSKLEAANNEMGSFNSQLESLQSHYDDQVRQHSPVVDGDEKEEEKLYVDEDDDDDISLQDLLAEAVLDSDDYLRSQIVVLAQALERSELQRADALERIFSERKTNADSLRQLGESVQRFYTTVK